MEGLPVRAALLVWVLAKGLGAHRGHKIAPLPASFGGWGNAPPPGKNGGAKATHFVGRATETSAAMCGRFTHRYTWAEIQRLYRLTSPASNVQPSYNVCPTDTVNVVTSSDDTRILQPMRWGMVPRWWSKPLKELMRLSTFNARVETVTTKPFFREAFRRTRCIIPASGYYEWQDTPDGKQPHYFTRTDGQVISFAGLWDEWKDRASGETVKSCTMIITAPNAMVAEVHDRMPVVLEPDQFTPWLENEAGLEILTP